jgi:hypothetical protein
VALGRGCKKYAVLEWSIGQAWDTKSFLKAFINGKFPKISLVSVWNEKSDDEELDRRINSTTANLRAYRTALSNPLLRPSPFR